MGSWGMEALESDEGLDLINWVEEQLQDDSTFDAESIVQRLSQHEDLFGFQGDEEFLYDNNVIGLVELIIQKAAGEKITSSKQIDQLDSYRLTSIFSKKLQGRLQTIDDTHEWIMLFEGRAREKAKAYLIKSSKDNSLNDKQGRAKLRICALSKPDRRSASGDLASAISQRNHSGLTPNRAESALMWGIVKDRCPDKIWLTRDLEPISFFKSA